MHCENNFFCPEAGAEGANYKLMGSFDLVGKEVTIRVLQTNKAAISLALEGHGVSTGDNTLPSYPIVGQLTCHTYLTIRIETATFLSTSSLPATVPDISEALPT